MDGWHAQERSGTWSSPHAAKIRVLWNANDEESLSVTMVASTLTGMGLHDQSQKLSIKIGERIAASRTISKGDGWLEIQFDVRHSDLSDDRVLIIEIVLDDAVNPGQLGLSADTRTLGVMVRNMIFKPKT